MRTRMGERGKETKRKKEKEKGREQEKNTEMHNARVQRKPGVFDEPAHMCAMPRAPVHQKNVPVNAASHVALVHIQECGESMQRHLGLKTPNALVG